MTLQARVEFDPAGWQPRLRRVRCIVTVPVGRDGSVDTDSLVFNIRHQAKHILRVRRPDGYSSDLRQAHTKNALCFVNHIVFDGGRHTTGAVYEEARQAFEAAIARLNIWLRIRTR